MTSSSIQFSFSANRLVKNGNIECNVNFYILYARVLMKVENKIMLGIAH